MPSEKLNKSLSHRVPSDVSAGGDLTQIQRIELLRGAAKIFGEAIEKHSKPSREQSLAITNLEQSLMWAVKGIVLE